MFIKSRTALRRAVTFTAIAFVSWRSFPVQVLGQQSAPVKDPVQLVFDHVTIIDVEHGQVMPEQRVVVVGHRITTTGLAQRVSLPERARVIDATGKYIIPGLWDMHVHTEAANSIGAAGQGIFHRHLYARFIANGVTGVREMAQRWGGTTTGAGSREATDSFRVWQRAIMSGTMIGPRGVGPSGDVTWMQPFVRVILDDPDDTTFGVNDAIRAIDSLKTAGDAFVKYHGYPDRRDIFFAFLRESRRVGIPVVGHVPGHVSNVEAADSGMRSIEHSELGACSQQHGMHPDFIHLAQTCAPTAQAYLRNGTWVTPTLADVWTYQWDTTVHATFSPMDSTPVIGAEYWAHVLQMWHAMHEMGVRNFLNGTDGPSGVWPQIVLPGLSTREEVVLLVDAGLTPLEALQAATLNPARFLQATDSLGTVAPGKLADLVLLDANPLVNITNVLKLWGVVANGRYFDHAALVHMDPDAFASGAGMIAFARRAQATAGPTKTSP